MSEAVLRALAAGSLHVAVLAAAALLLERALGARLTPRFRLALWLVVVARLTLPALPEVPRAFAPPTARLARPLAGALGGEADGAPGAAPLMERARAAAAVPRPGTGSEHPARAARPTTGRPPRRAAAAHGATLPAGGAPAPSPSAASPAAASPSAASPSAASPSAASPGLGAAQALVLAWLAGAVTALVRLARAELRLRAALRHAATAPPSVAATAAAAARCTGLRRTPRVLLTDAVDSPAVHGLLRPTVLVPPGLLALAERELACVLAHECCHVRRGDLLLAPAFAALRALWWFHPLARLALARAADALEEARDADALRALEVGPAAPHTPARVLYARVLVRLAEARAGDAPPTPAPGALAMAVRPRGLTRRVHMILDPRRPSPPLRLLGAAAVGSLGWLGLVAAAPASVPEAPGVADGPPPALPTAAPRSAERPAPQARIAVERPSAPSPWRAEIEARLDARLDAVTFERAQLPDALRSLAAQAGVAIELDDEVAANEREYWVTLDVRDVTTREVLAVLCEYGDGLDRALAPAAGQGVLRVGAPGSLPRETELRLYKVQPLVAALRAPFGEADVTMDDLIELVMVFGTSDPWAWDLEGSSIEAWEGLLCVQQTPEVHAEVHAFLERLAARRAAPDRAAEAWRADLSERLARPVTARFEGTPVSEAVASLAALGGVSIVDPEVALEEYDVVEPLDLDLRGVPLAEALQRCLRGTDLAISARAGGVEVRHSPALEVHLHQVGPLLEGLDAARRAERFEGIEQFLRTTVDPASWDSFERVGHQRIGDLLVVCQTPDNQVKVAALLDQLARALAH